ncbi:MAG TPA: phosphate--AMP phosphotransferase [Candidatus Limnocylindria bacterium]|nr:phosphate--AMP phosphotransferase [Candidatus Limnocylindria bacterium]
MLETIDLTLALEKAPYRAELEKLRTQLRDLQNAARSARIPVVVVFEGWDASGKGDSIGNLLYPLDPRGFKVHTTQAPTPEEQLRPFLTRFWTRMPKRGDFALFDRSWYRRLLEDRLAGLISPDAVAGVAAEIRDFEHLLTNDATVVVKMWLHISRKEQRRRLKRIQADPYEQWRVAQKDWRRRAGYKRYAAAAEDMFERTSSANAPWTIVEANDARFRRIKVMRTVVAAVRAALASPGRNAPRATKAPPVTGARAEPAPRGAPKPTRRVQRKGPPTILDRVDLSRKLSRAAYQKRLDPLQERLRGLVFECYRVRLPVVIVYEGWDASGKGGNIKRLTQELDPRAYEVVPIAAPDASERAHHYLWRFWRQLPKAGHVVIFDRSWYGRVLVERVEGFATVAEWRRAYEEINEFERLLEPLDTVILKFWLHLSPEEQLRRFEARERTPHKHHKIGDEDWRNRAKWNDYRAAVAEMLERTSTAYAPWTVVEAENKLWARIRTLAATVRALERRLKARARK